jgi:hypothetical protein
MSKVDLAQPKMDLKFALRTIDAYPEDQPPASQSDRFWFELAARFLASTVQELRTENKRLESAVVQMSRAARSLEKRLEAEKARAFEAGYTPARTRIRHAPRNPR